MYLRTVAAAVVETVQAPPATVFLQALQFQMPTACRFTESYINQSTNKYRGTDSRESACLSAEGAGVSCVLGDFHLFVQG